MVSEAGDKLEAGGQAGTVSKELAQSRMRIGGATASHCMALSWPALPILGTFGI